MRCRAVLTRRRPFPVIQRHNGLRCSAPNSLWDSPPASLVSEGVKEGWTQRFGED